MTCSSGTNRSPSGITTKRGSSGGTFTRANRRSLGDRVAEHHGQVQREVGDVREGVAGVDGQRREHREDALLELLDQVLAVVVVELVPAREHGCRPSASAGHDSSRNIVLQPVGQLGRPVRGSQPAARPGCGRRGCASRCPATTWSLQTGHPDLEELVEVLAEDGQNLARSSSGTTRSLGQGQHPRVEVEPRQLPVEVALRPRSARPTACPVGGREQAGTMVGASNARCPRAKSPRLQGTPGLGADEAGGARTFTAASPRRPSRGVRRARRRRPPRRTRATSRCTSRTGRVPNTLSGTTRSTRATHGSPRRPPSPPPMHHQLDVDHRHDRGDRPRPRARTASSSSAVATWSPPRGPRRTSSTSSAPRRPGRRGAEGSPAACRRRASASSAGAPGVGLEVADAPAAAHATLGPDGGVARSPRRTVSPRRRSPSRIRPPPTPVPTHTARKSSAPAAAPSCPRRERPRSRRCRAGRGRCPRATPPRGRPGPRAGRSRPGSGRGRARRPHGRPCRAPRCRCADLALVRPGRLLDQRGDGLDHRVGPVGGRRDLARVVRLAVVDHRAITFVPPRSTPTVATGLRPRSSGTPRSQSRSRLLPLGVADETRSRLRRNCGSCGGSSWSRA